jgi:hypothetical protein
VTRHCLFVTIFLCPLLLTCMALASQPDTSVESTSSNPIVLFLLVDGSDKRHTDAALSAVGLFGAKLQRQDSYQILVFDKEPNSNRILDPLPVDSPFLPLRPRLPMRDAISKCLDAFARYPRQSEKVIVIFVDEESYASWISKRQLLESSRKSGAIIYGIIQSERNGDERKGFIHRMWNAIADAGIWMLDGLTDNPVPSRKNTHDLLDTISIRSGGKICSAAGAATMLKCAQKISDEIRSAER